MALLTWVVVLHWVSSKDFIGEVDIKAKQETVKE